MFRKCKAAKRYSYSRSIHHQSNINWTILSTVRLIETREEMNCTFKYRAHSWLQILEVKLKKQRLETISINSWKRAFRLCFIKQVFTRALSWGAAAFYGKTKSANRCRISMNKNKYDANKIFKKFKILVLARTLLLWLLPFKHIFF